MPADDPPYPAKDMLGAYIRAQRQLADLSLRRLAELSNVSNAYLSQVERGLHQPSVKVLRSIAQALNVSGESLLSQAGLVDDVAQRSAARSDTELAISSDPDLTTDEKQTMLMMYRGFRDRKDR